MDGANMEIKDMISNSLAHAKRMRCQTRRLAAVLRYVKTSRSRSERRAARQALGVGAEELAPVLKTNNHVGAAAWVIT